jgi:SAM-dependent methyltransferase
MIGKLHEYEAMAKCEKELWWYKCLHELTLKKIRQFSLHPNIKILDAGCGTGGMLAHLKKKAYNNIKGFDISADAVAFAKKNGLDVCVLDLLKADQFFPPNSFDVIISHDNLYFFQNGEDKEVVNKLSSLLKPRGLLLINLPAGKLFKGSHDIAVGITKRYSTKRVQSFASDTIAIAETIHWPFMLSPIIFIVRTMQRISMAAKTNKNVTSDVKIPSPFLNNFFYAITSWENATIKTKPWGSSIFVVMKKNSV